MSGDEVPDLPVLVEMMGDPVQIIATRDCFSIKAVSHPACGTDTVILLDAVGHSYSIIAPIFRAGDSTNTLSGDVIAASNDNEQGDGRGQSIQGEYPGKNHPLMDDEIDYFL